MLVGGVGSSMSGIGSIWPVLLTFELTLRVFCSLGGVGLYGVAVFAGLTVPGAGPRAVASIDSPIAPFDKGSFAPPGLWLDQ